MSYPGNPSLAQDVQERISTTFQQTLDLVDQGKDQEAQVGCDFILRMDPLFRPAQTLIERLRGSQRPVPTDDLRDGGGAPGPATPSAGGGEELGELGSLGEMEELGELEELSLEDEASEVAATPPSPPPASPTPAAPAKPAAPAAPQGGAAGGLAAVLQDLLAKRNYQQVMQIAESQGAEVEKDPQLQKLVEEAWAKQESDSYVKAFLKSAREAREAGKQEEMEKQLAKARALDPEHPEVLAFSREAAAQSTAAGPPSGGRPAADADLLALQQQSLSLEEGPDDTAGEGAPELGGELPEDLELTDLSFDDDQAPAGDRVAEKAGADDFAFDASFDDDLAGIDFGEGSADATEQATFGEETADFRAETGAAEAGGFTGEETADFRAETGTAEAGGVTGAETTDFAAAEAAEGGAEVDAESRARIDQLLTEGQGVFDRGEYQAAIDVWSRIFLIDIDNAEASKRIEEARNKKAELERQAEEIFHQAAAQIEGKELEEAKESLRRVLELQPSHSLAREYLDQLEAGKVPAVRAAGDAELAGELDMLDTLEGVPGADEDGVDTGASSLEAAVQRDRIAVVKKTDKRLVAVGAAVALLVVGGIYYLVTQWDELFPNQEAPVPVARQQVDPIERAIKMHEAGNTENAIILLERIQPQDPSYEEAQAQLAQLKAEVETSPEEVAAGPSEEQVRRYELLVGAGTEAHSQGRFIRTRKYLERAAKIAPLEEPVLQMLRDAEAALEDLEGEIEQFNAGEYAQVIPTLWRKREEDPDNPDIELLLVDSYYNLALTDLQRGDPTGAAAKLADAFEVQPENEELERMLLFAQTYEERPKDLLYRIYVKYLPSR
jgi:tetratricopeptide (TPR) repeat protein